MMVDGSIVDDKIYILMQFSVHLINEQPMNSHTSQGFIMISMFVNTFYK